MTGDSARAAEGAPRAEQPLRQQRAIVPLSLALAAAAGATDVLCVTQLGGAFGSVMTGNLVLLGSSLPRQDATLAVSVGTALTGFILGVALGSLVVGRRSRSARGRAEHLVAALAIELALLVGLLIAWVVTDGAPAGLLRGLLLGTAALAMGVQTGAYRSIHGPLSSTTYFTGTLTGVVGDLVGRRVRWAEMAEICALVAGACLSGLLVITAVSWAVVLPVALVAVVLAGALTGAGARQPGA